MMTAPFGRRLCHVMENRSSGGYRVVSLSDSTGPEPLPGQFYMLAAEAHWEERGQRPFLPRALSVADVRPGPGGRPAGEGGAVEREMQLDFLIEGIGPGTDRLCALAPGERVWVNGPLGNGFSAPRELAPKAVGAILVGGGIGIAPLALLRRRLAADNMPARVLLGFRDAAHSGGLDDLFACGEVGVASEDGHTGRRGYVTDLLEAMLAGDDTAGAAIYACGPPPMLEAVASLCATHEVPGELAMEAPMACGYGACFGCAVPKPDGGYMRLCVDGPVVRVGAQAERAGASLNSFDKEAARAPEETQGASRPDNRRSDETSDLSIRPFEGHPAFPPGNHAGAVRFCGLELVHPVVNASGTFDALAARRVYGDAVLEEFPFAAYVSKTITLEPRAGNEPQRIWETPAGMINSIGLPNKGVEGFIAEDLPQLAELPVPLIVSVMGTSREQFSRLVEGIAGREEVAAIELNVSCPNVHSGLIVGEQPSETAALLEAVRPLTDRPLIVKLTPNVADPAEIAVAAEEGGANAVSLINTMKAAAIDPLTRRPGIAAGHGGLSGPAIRAIAVAQVRAVSAATSIPIVGMGGVGSGADALELLCAGATLVAVGTESFRDPGAGRRIAEELSEHFSDPVKLDLDSRSR